MLKRYRKLYFVLLGALVIGAHVALWLSDDVPRSVALRLTQTNAAIWAVLIVPAIFLTWRVRRGREGGGDGKAKR